MLPSHKNPILPCASQIVQWTGSVDVVLKDTLYTPLLTFPNSVCALADTLTMRKELLTTWHASISRGLIAWTCARSRNLAAYSDVVSTTTNADLFDILSLKIEPPHDPPTRDTPPLIAYTAYTNVATADDDTASGQSNDDERNNNHVHFTNVPTQSFDPTEIRLPYLRQNPPQNQRTTWPYHANQPNTTPQANPQAQQSQPTVTPVTTPGYPTPTSHLRTPPHPQETFQDSYPSPSLLPHPGNTYNAQIRQYLSPPAPYNPTSDTALYPHCHPHYDNPV